MVQISILSVLDHDGRKWFSYERVSEHFSYERDM